MTLQLKPHLDRALISLDGLSVGDAFGQMLSTCARRARSVVERDGLPTGPWWHTDDTQMAMAIVEELSAHGRIEADSLAGRFAERFQADPGRGDGKGARMQLEEIARGASWRQTSAAAFGGSGSKGNGSAMRSASLGAWFADDLVKVVADYREALFATLEGDGDCDTNCAIVGGIVALRVGREGIPAVWLASREPLKLNLEAR